MLSPSHKSQVASIIAVVLLMPIFYPSLAAARGKTSATRTQGEQEKNNKEKPEKSPKDEKNNLSKQERQWLEVFRFSKQRYETNP